MSKAMIDFGLPPENARTETRFGSRQARVARLLQLDGAAHLVCIYLGENGALGGHPAAVNQLFLVISGSGWVQGKDGEAQPINAGQAVFWEAGEWHETSSEKGLTAIVVEGPGIDPSIFNRP